MNDYSTLSYYFLKLFIPDIYGPEKIWSGFASYKGFLPFNDEIYLDAMRKSGIVLVMHSNDHLKYNLPSARIFEAIGSSAIVISDQLKFVKDNFGDNVLYIEQTQSAQELFKQIDKHIHWIKNNPEKARIMAQNANAILQKRFTMESSLQKVDKLHNIVQMKKHNKPAE